MVQSMKERLFRQIPNFINYSFLFVKHCILMIEFKPWREMEM